MMRSMALCGADFQGDQAAEAKQYQATLPVEASISKQTGSCRRVVLSEVDAALAGPRVATLPTGGEVCLMSLAAFAADPVHRKPRTGGCLKCTRRRPFSRPFN